MASASSRITSLKPFLGRQMAPSEDVFNLPSTSGPNLQVHYAIRPCLRESIPPRPEQSRLLWSHRGQACHSTLRGTEVWLGYFCYIAPPGTFAFPLCTQGVLFFGPGSAFLHHLRPRACLSFHLFLVHHLPVIPPDLNSCLFKFKLAHLVLGCKQFLVNESNEVNASQTTC